MQDDQPGRAPNYTSACIIMFGVNLTWIMFTVWINWGLLAVVLMALALNHLISWVEVKSARARAAAIRRGKGWPD